MGNWRTLNVAWVLDDITEAREKERQRGREGWRKRGREREGGRDGERINSKVLTIVDSGWCM